MNKTILLLGLFLFSACSGSQIKARESGALIGGAIGAGLGAIVGHKTGSSGAGVAIGGAVGAISGGLFGNNIDNENDRLDAQGKKIESQASQIEENRRILEELKKSGADVSQSDRGVVVNLPDVLFEFNKSKLTRSAINKVKDISDIVRRYPNHSLSVEGHTDSVGTLVYNKKLSQNRARSVADELVAQGVSRRRVSSVGYGESRPISLNASDSGRSKNRRVEVIIK